jgi:hypothetical protein
VGHTRIGANFSWLSVGAAPSTERNFNVAPAGVLFFHVPFNFLFIVPATIVQVRDLRRQLADLRRVRRGLDGTPIPDTFRHPVRRVISALYVRYSDHQIRSTSSNGTNSSDSSQRRLLLLETVCVNLITVNLFYLAGNIALQPMIGYTLRLLATGRVRDGAIINVQVAML